MGAGGPCGAAVGGWGLLLGCGERGCLVPVLPAGLVEWAAPAQEALQRPVPPLSAAAVRGFISAAFGPLSERQRVRVEPAAEDAKSTLDVLEEFARRREGGAVTVEDAERHAVISERFFRPPNGFFFA